MKIRKHMKKHVFRFTLILIGFVFAFTGSASGEGETAAEGGAQSLAKRMCGKYSYLTRGDDFGNAEYDTMHVVAFGDNLYALCGQAMAKDDGAFENYNFWACEFIPYHADDMRSGEGGSARVRGRCFSAMSNTGKYWGEGSDGTVTVTEDGLWLKGFEDEFFSPAEYGGRLFLRDERVEDAFPFLRRAPEEPAADADPRLEGLWMQDDESAPLFLEFKGGNLLIYRKKLDTEVFYAAGAYACLNGALAGGMAVLGHGNAQKELRAEYEIRGERLYAAFYSETLPLPEGRCAFKRANPTDIHVAAMDGAERGDDKGDGR